MRILLAAILLSTATGAASLAHAGEVAPTVIPLVPDVVSVPAAASAAPSDSELAAMVGGQSTTTAIAMTDQDLTAISSGNRVTADSVTSGAISLQDNALSGFNGIGNFTMNTGHNNNLQSSMSVTIIVTQ